MNFEQNSPEWYAWRNTGLGASDAPVILGESKYKKAFQLFQEKTGRVTEPNLSNPGIERGRELEPVAREKFAAGYWLVHKGADNFEACNVQHAEIPFMRASLDGRSDDKKTIIEIKYQGKANHELARHGQIQRAHYIQVQHQLMVSDAERAFLVSINDAEEIISVPVYRNENDMQDILRACQEFWSNVQANRWPGEVRNDTSAGVWFEAWAEIKQQIQSLEEQKKTIEKHIFDSGVTVCGDYRVTEVTRMGSVKYDSIPQLAGLDLDQYRGKPTVYKQIKGPK